MWIYMSMYRVKQNEYPNSSTMVVRLRRRQSCGSGKYGWAVESPVHFLESVESWLFQNHQMRKETEARTLGLSEGRHWCSHKLQRERERFQKKARNIFEGLGFLFQVPNSSPGAICIAYIDVAVSWTAWILGMTLMG